MARQWRAKAEAERLSIRELIIEVTARQQFVDTVVPELQERGVFRTEYTGTTLREHLGSAHPHGPIQARVA